MSYSFFALQELMCITPIPGIIYYWMYTCIIIIIYELTDFAYILQLRYVFIPIICCIMLLLTVYTYLLPLEACFMLLLVPFFSI